MRHGWAIRQNEFWAEYGAQAGRLRHLKLCYLIIKIARASRSCSIILIYNQFHFLAVIFCRLHS